MANLSFTNLASIIEMQFTINDLPDEILASIFGDLSLEDRAQCKSVCDRWKWIIENLICVHSLLMSSDSRRSFGQANGRLCNEQHHFAITTPVASDLRVTTNNSVLIVSPIDNVDLIFTDNHLTRIRALKIDLDSQLELRALRWSRILRLLDQSPLLEHLELRAFTKQEFDYLSVVSDHLIIYHQRLLHLSLKKIEYMDFLYIRNLDLFEQLFARLANLTVFECDFCLLNHTTDATSLQTTHSQSINRKQLSKLYLPNANSISIGLIEEYDMLQSLGLGLVDEILLNQLLNPAKYKRLSHLEFKIREELNGEFITNYSIKQLTIHSLSIRERVNNVLAAFRSIEVLSLINCLLTMDTVKILIANNAKCLRSLCIQNDYWDDDRQVDHLIIRCFEKCNKLVTGEFKNVNLKYFYKFIYSLAIKNPQTNYEIRLDYTPTNNEFQINSNSNNETDRLPANLQLSILRKDYNY